MNKETQQVQLIREILAYVLLKTCSLGLGNQKETSRKPHGFNGFNIDFDYNKDI